MEGLLHDLGHGPFSHTFENQVVPRVLPGLKWWAHSLWSGEHMHMKEIVHQCELSIDEMSIGQVQCIA